MSRTMTHEEFQKILERIENERHPFKSRVSKSGRSLMPIKYVDPHYDNRTNTWFAVNFRTFGGPIKEFHCANECRDLKESLFERINAWLDQEDWTQG